MAAPEAANNAGAQTSFIPMLTLGIPSNPVMALMIGAMIIQGIQPGPSVMTEQPALFWGIDRVDVDRQPDAAGAESAADRPVGEDDLGAVSPALSGHPRVLRDRRRSACRTTPFDVYLMAVFGLLGYIFHKFDCEPAPMLLGFILGPMMEEFLRRALLLSKGDPMVLVTRPISATMLALSMLALIAVLTPALQKKREEAFHEQE